MTDAWITDYSAHLDAGMALMSQGAYEAAIQKYDAAIAVNPSISAGYVNRGLALFQLKNFDAALQNLNTSIDLQPTLAMAYNNRGAVKRSLGQVDAAAQDYLKAIELGGDAMFDAHGNLATYYFETKQFELARAYYEKAIALRPDYGLTHWNYGMYLLLFGDYENGWREYHGRWQDAAYCARHRAMSGKLWLGQESLLGKTILLQAEQAFGDMIQFCRYGRVLAAQGARVILEVNSELVELCKTLAGVMQVISRTDALPSHDFYCPMMSLPLACATTLSSIPAPVRYLSSSPVKAQAWTAKLGIKTKPRIGVVWSSDPHLAVGAYKTIALQTFSTLLSDQFEFVSLQQKVRDTDATLLSQLPVRHFGDDLYDFSDTAALCELMDLVISVDTSVAHLAGALGKPTWILLHGHADWRWLLDRSDSVWYPTAKLYRQKTNGWEGLIAAVKTDLAAYFK